jgi:hypothetical protein
MGNETGGCEEMRLVGAAEPMRWFAAAYLAVNMIDGFEKKKEHGREMMKSMCQVYI